MMGAVFDSKEIASLVWIRDDLRTRLVTGDLRGHMDWYDYHDLLGVLDRIVWRIRETATGP